jgi:hypothetical protein
MSGSKAGCFPASLDVEALLEERYTVMLAA